MPIYEYKGTRPTLGQNVFIAPNATIIGDVHLGDLSSVWFGTVIRGDVYPIRFGARTNLQDGSVVHVTGDSADTKVGDDVTIGHMVLLHGCTIGNRCLIGMGSIVLDGAEVGDECLSRPARWWRRGAKFPPRSMMGQPGRRSCARAHRTRTWPWCVRRGVLYVEYARTFRSDAVKLVAT